MSEWQDTIGDDLVEIKRAIQDIEAQIEGVIRAEGLLESLPEFPTFVNYFVSGVPSYSTGRGCVILHRLNADLHVSRSVLPSDELEVIPFIMLTIAEFARHITLDGLCDHCIIQRYTVGGFDYGEEKTYGIRFEFEIKKHHSGITVAA